MSMSIPGIQDDRFRCGDVARVWSVDGGLTRRHNYAATGGHAVFIDTRDARNVTTCCPIMPMTIRLTGPHPPAVVDELVEAGTRDAVFHLALQGIYPWPSEKKGQRSRQECINSG